MESLISTEGMDHTQAILHLMENIDTLMFRIDNIIDDRPKADYTGRTVDLFVRNWLKQFHNDLLGHMHEYQNIWVRIMKHEFGMWNPLRDRKCNACGLSESNVTTDCLGKPIGRLWLLAFQDDICDYVNDEWVDWTGRPIGDDVAVVRRKSAAYIQKKEAEGTRARYLKDKMEMEDELLTHSKYRGFNPRPFD
jgi:hypothetical protein